MQLKSSGHRGQSVFADGDLSSSEELFPACSAMPSRDNNLTKSMQISTRNAPTLPNFKFLFQSVEAPEVLRQRERRKKNVGKTVIFP